MQRISSGKMQTAQPVASTSGASSSTASTRTFLSANLDLLPTSSKRRRLPTVLATEDTETTIKGRPIAPMVKHKHSDISRVPSEASVSAHKHHHRRRTEDARASSSVHAADADGSVESILSKFKRECETLKKALHESKKNVKKRDKRIEELKADAANANEAKDAAEAKVQAVKAELKLVKAQTKKNEDLISTVEANMQCQICMELLSKPYALSPCGHILCLECLQQWFRTAGQRDSDDEEDGDMELDLMSRPKSCPCCRADISVRPMPVFVIKSVVYALNKRNGVTRPASPIDADADPWNGIFHPVGHESNSDESDDNDSVMQYDFDEDFDSLGIAEDIDSADDENGLQYEGTGSEEEEDSEDSDSEQDLAEYVPACWEPPSLAVDLGVLVQESDVPLLRRGCTTMMIRTFRMSYSHDNGLLAVVPRTDIEDEMSNNLIYLGWNVRLSREDWDGRDFISWVEEDIEEHPERWDYRIRPDGDGEAWVASKLVKRSVLMEYEDSDTDAWFDEGSDED